MAQRVRAILDDSLAAHTRGAYMTAWGSYCEWCAVHNIVPLPVIERHLCVWLIWLTMFITVPSARLYMFGVQSVALESGQPCDVSGMRLLERVLRGLRRRYGSGTTPLRRPLTVTTLARIRPSLDFTLHDHRCMWAAACCGVYALWRAGEFLANDRTHAPMLVSHMSRPSPAQVDVLLPVSKTDVFRRGVTTHVFRNSSATCPLTALDFYLTHSTVNLTPAHALFTLSSGLPLDRRTMIAFLQSLVARAGLPDAHLYNGISFRKGGASSLAAAGVPDRVIKAAGRWRSECYQLYVQLSLSELQSASRRVAALDPVTVDDHVWGAFDSDRLFHDADAEATVAQMWGAAHRS